MAGEEDYSGMTVNERLFTAGLLEEWDAATSARDRGHLVAILRQVHVSDPDRSVDAHLARPTKYGA
jgi:hypothetical protein